MDDIRKENPKVQNKTFLINNINNLNYNHQKVTCKTLCNAYRCPTYLI